MDINILTEIINRLGFPIAMVGYFIWDRTTSSKEFRLTIDALRETIENNTLILSKLLIKLNSGELEVTDHEK